MLKVVGHEWAVTLLMNGFQAGKVPHAMLLTGLPNVGKTTLARYYAAAINCTGETGQPCGQCQNCRKILSGNHPDVVLMDNLEEALKIDQVRQLQQQLALTPYEGRWRVAILSDFERATPEAANALLKTLEEPAPQVVLILTATEADILLPTIVSRCQLLSLRPLPVERVRDALVNVWHADTKEADLLSHLSGGRLGWAVTARTDRTLLERRETALDDMVDLGTRTRVDRLAYAAGLARNPQVARDTLRHWLSWWHDLLLLVAGVQDVTTNIDRAAVLHHQADQVTLQEAQRVVEQIGYTTRSLEQNANLRLALEVLTLSLPRQTR